MRQLLPPRRDSELFDFEHDGITYRASASRFENGSLAELFLDGGKPDTAVAIIGRDLAVAASLALQYGCPVDTLRKALSHLSDGRAAGPLGAAIDLLEAHQ